MNDIIITLFDIEGEKLHSFVTTGPQTLDLLSPTLAAYICTLIGADFTDGFIVVRHNMHERLFSWPDMVPEEWGKDPFAINADSYLEFAEKWDRKE